MKGLKKQFQMKRTGVRRREERERAEPKRKMAKKVRVQPRLSAAIRGIRRERKVLMGLVMSIRIVSLMVGNHLPQTSQYGRPGSQEDDLKRCSSR